MAWAAGGFGGLGPGGGGAAGNGGGAGPGAWNVLAAKRGTARAFPLDTGGVGSELDGFPLIDPCSHKCVKGLDLLVVWKASLDDFCGKCGVVVKGVPTMPDTLGIERICSPASK